MISNPPIRTLIFREKKSKDFKEKPGSGMNSKRLNTSNKGEPNRVSTWMFDENNTHFDLNYFFVKNQLQPLFTSIDQIFKV